MSVYTAPTTALPEIKIVSRLPKVTNHSKEGTEPGSGLLIVLCYSTPEVSVLTVQYFVLLLGLPLLLCLRVLVMRALVLTVCLRLPLSVGVFCLLHCCVEPPTL